MNYFYLCRPYNEDTPESIKITSKRFSIGRDTTNKLLLNCSSISEKHACIHLREQHYYLKDLGSTNGSYCNGKKVQQEQLLNEGDHLRFGDIEFNFHRSPQALEITKNSSASKAIKAKKKQSEKRKLTCTKEIKLTENVKPKSQNCYAASFSFMAHISIVVALIFFLKGYSKEAPKAVEIVMEAPHLEEALTEEALENKDTESEIQQELQPETSNTLVVPELEPNMESNWDSPRENVDYSHLDSNKLFDQQNTPDLEIQRRLKKYQGRHQDTDIRVTLLWHDQSDLDLIITTPLQEELSFHTRIDSFGGYHDIDKNAQKPFTRQPIENIVWPRKHAALGEYQVHVRLYSKNKVARRSIPFKVELQSAGDVLHFQGALQKEKSQTLVTSFNFGYFNSSPPYHLDRDIIKVPFIKI